MVSEKESEEFLFEVVPLTKRTEEYGKADFSEFSFEVQLKKIVNKKTVSSKKCILNYKWNGLQLTRSPENNKCINVINRFLPKDKSKSIILDEKILKGFEKCEYSEEFKELSLQALKEKTPLEIDKRRSTVKYQAEGTFYGLPIESIEKGVCYFPLDEDSFSCGFAYYTALIISKPFNEVKGFLKKSTGIDFTKKLSDKETGSLLKPVLIPYEGGKKSILYCDAGNL